MSKFSLKNFMGGSNPQKVLLAETRKLVKKWEPTGLLEGLKNETEIRGMAVLLENQAKQLIDESSRISSDGTEEWSGVALPLVRRIFGEVAAKEFVSVQPMNLPAGLIFFLDFKYGSGTQPGFTQGKSLYGGDNNVDGTAGLFGRTNSATGGFYGAGKFGYTINDYQSSSLVGTLGSASWYDVDFQSDLSASAVAGLLKTFTVTLGGEIDKEGVRAFEILSGSGTAVTYFPQFTAVAANGANYNVVFVISSSTANALAMTSASVVKYHKQPIASERGDFEDLSTSGSYLQLDIPEIDLIMKSEPIIAKTRKLKAVWTPELVQDLNAYHSIDAEAELTSMLSEYISMEIDLEILDMLIQNALIEDYWSARIGYDYNSTSKVFAQTAANVAAYQQPTWFQTLGTKIQKVSNKIHQRTLRGGANFMVVSPEVATILESIPGYQVNTDGDQMSFAMGVTKSATFANRFTIYKNPYMLTNVILLGYKGTSFLESGAAYCPFIPLIMTPVIYDVNNFTPRRGVMTRYAKKMIRPEFYGRIIIEGLETL
jgi:hypothetical protein